MGSAVEIRTDRIEIPKLADVLVRDPDGAFVTEYSTADERTTVEAGSYDLDLTTAPLKLHLLVESDLEIYRTDRTSVVVEFGSEVEVTVGARSFHERPAGTITVTEDVTDLMRAVSLFGTALKTTSPERSFPTLRGHPPRIKLGDRFRVSKGIDPPETGVRLVVPAERRLVYTVAPLAYYLGAEVVTGDAPRLETDDWSHSFPDPSGTFGWDREADEFERAVHRTFGQVFFLDCLTRTEGIYPVDLYESTGFEERTDADLDFAALYDRPLAARVETYLDVPYIDVAPYVPAWNLLVDVVPAAEHDEVVPYLVNDLALIRCTPPPEHRQLRPDDELSIELHGKQEPTEPPNEGNPDIHEMSYAGKSFEPAPTDAIEHAHLGDGYPENSNKLLLKGFQNQLEAPRTDGSSVKVHVVCNDEETAERGLLPHVYNDRNLIDVEVSYDELVWTSKLRRILESDVDFLHFVGEVTSEGLVCTDGVVKPRRVHDLGVRAFFLQTCQNYTDAEWLIGRGAYGGVVSTAEIRDGDDVLTMGRWMSRLLGEGFTLRSAATIANRANPGEMEYTILGDGGVALTQPVGGQPYVVEIHHSDDKSHLISLKTYKAAQGSHGTVWFPTLPKLRNNYLAPVNISREKVDREVVSDLLKAQPTPVNLRDEWEWSDLPGFDRYL
jgi:hypothetical protein